MKFEFEYDIRDGQFDLYQRGGDNYLARRTDGIVKGNIGPNSPLNMLYPVARTSFTNLVKESFEDAFKQFIQMFHSNLKEGSTFKVRNMKDGYSLEGAVAFDWQDKAKPILILYNP